MSIFYILFNVLQCETIHIHHLLRSLNSVCKIALQAFSKTERNRKRLSLVEDRNRGRSGSSPVETLLHYPTQTTSFFTAPPSATKSRFLLCIVLLTKLNYFQQFEIGFWKTSIAILRRSQLQSKGIDPQLKKLTIVKQIMLVSILTDVWRTFWHTDVMV